MPNKRCQLNNKPGWKWGDAGKCYTYDPNNKSSETKAKNKARAQGIAIGDYFNEVLEKMAEMALAAEIISFDFDGVLSTKKYQDLALELKKSGNRIIIITARHDSDMGPVYEVAKSIGIPRTDVHNTNGRDKYPAMSRYNVTRHYDNNKEQIDKINEKTKTKGILV